MIPWLEGDDPFPPLTSALMHPNGLLAAGADLSPERLLAAYRLGIFPWYSEDEPILWWSPDPRMVLIPSELKISRSLAKTLRNRGHEIRFDTAFEAVMHGCATRGATHAARGGSESGTWITDAMRAAYLRLHELGYAHSAETWIEGELAGGLYGVAIGRMFYGESMFTRVRDASKMAMVHLVQHLERQGCGMIDCQMHTTHLASLGARAIPRSEFSQRLRELVDYALTPTKWSSPEAGNDVAA
ncbi:MAG: leucyl/phenylalanyl-tRNA--protein transferase [Burkholderiales bacterium]|nr:leucyl/phenylalanyl-tRNA--protein transferase [Burkholderiales bacterium]